MTHSMTCHRFRLVEAFTIAAVVAMLASPTWAEAVIVRTYYNSINVGAADFGGPFHALGGPTDDAVITWDYDTSSGQLIATARVRGTLYWDDLFSSGCTRITIRFRNPAGVNLATRIRDVCGPGGNANSSANKVQVDESFSSPNLARLRIDVARTSAGPSQSGFFTDAAPLSRSFDASVVGGLAYCGKSHALSWSFTDTCVFAFDRDNGVMSGSVSGPLGVALNRSGICARAVITFRAADNSILGARTRETCDSRTLAESFDSGSLSRIRFHVGELSGNNFTNVQFVSFDFNGQTGDFTVPADEQSAAVGEPLVYPVTWTVPAPENWHDLESVQVRISDETGTVLWVRFDEASNSFSAFNEASGRFTRSVKPGERASFQSPVAALEMARTTVGPVNSVLGTGPTSPSVRLNLGLRFKPSAAGRTFNVEVAAADDFGNEDPFAFAGTLIVAK